jgi:hypothetical protein
MFIRAGGKYMSMEWFYRMENVVRQTLPDVCEDFGDVDVLFDTDTTEQHPAFVFSVFYNGVEDEFCVVRFDPNNQEFYSYHYDEETELHAKVLFANLDQMLNFIHASYHEYAEEIEVWNEDDEEFEDEVMSNSEIYSESHIEWITNDKYLHIEDNTRYSNMKQTIHYKLGIVKQTGEGVLFRNTITKQNGDESDEKVMMYFKEEEASYIVDLLQDYMAYHEKMGK